MAFKKALRRSDFAMDLVAEREVRGHCSSALRAAAATGAAVVRVLTPCLMPGRTCAGARGRHRQGE